MNKGLDVTPKRWKLFCGIVMLSALVIAIIGSLAFLTPKDGRSSNSELGDGLFFIVWAFGLIGLLLCYIENATGKKLMAITGFGLSALLLTWDAVAHKCNTNDLCPYDTSQNGWLVATCLTVLAFLLAYDKAKEKIPKVGRVFIKIFTRSMIVVWVCALLFTIATFNKSLPLRIDRTPHQTTQQSIN